MLYSTFLSNLLIVTSVLRPLFPPMFLMRLVSTSAKLLTSASTVAAASLSFLFLRPFSLEINGYFKMKKTKSHAAIAALNAARLHLINKITADVCPGDCIIAIPAVSELHARFSH